MRVAANESLFGIMILLSLSNQSSAQSLESWASTAVPHFVPAKACKQLAHRRTGLVSLRAEKVRVSAGSYCKLIGTIEPALTFELDLPDTWNGRLLMVGNGGFAGELMDDRRVVRQRERALGRGFACLFSNGGHEGKGPTDASFASDRRKLMQFAQTSVHETLARARPLVTSYYRRATRHSYFDGCSTGGRQGLVEAQRFPQDFDGILVGSPMADYVGTMLSTVWIERSLDQGRFPTSKLPMIANHLYAKCDPLDGVRDNLIADPRVCHFQPARDVPICRGADNANCLTVSQAHALTGVYSDVISRGHSIFPGWLPGGEATGLNPYARGVAPGWVPMLLQDGRASWGREITESFFRNIAFPTRPDYQLSSFDFDRDAPLLVGWRRLFDARNPNLTVYAKTGGKLLMYHGWADPALNPLMSTTYYEDVQRKMGAGASEVVRLFMVPGKFHCAGGVGPHQLDALTPLIHWVEQGVAPPSIIAFDPRPSPPIKSRLICPYPSRAQLKPLGDMRRAEGFICAPPGS